MNSRTHFLYREIPFDDRSPDSVYVFEIVGNRLVNEDLIVLGREVRQRVFNPDQNPPLLQRGDSVTTIPSPEIRVPLESETPASYIRVPVNHEELVKFYKILRQGFDF